MRRTGFVALVVVLFYGCGGNPAAPSNLPLGQPFELRVGASARLDDNLRLIYDVRRDSRCPTGVVCVRAGDALLELSLSKAEPVVGNTLTLIGISGAGETYFIEGKEVTAPGCGGSIRTICLLSTEMGKTTASTPTHTVTLTDLKPYPAAGTQTPPADYVATFIVSRR